MIKKLLLFFVFTSLVSHAQIGIGTTIPDPSSMLDIRSSNAGLLIPRVNLTSTSDNTTIPNPALSLMIYNLSTQNDITPGFYFWQGGTWRALSQSSATALPTSGWSLSGNNLTSGNEFLGSTNYQPLNFRVNNQQAGRIHPNGGIAFGNGALANDNNSVAIGTSATSSSSNQAIAIGQSSNASGFQSTALGFQAIATNNNTLALGTNANASGFQSYSLGVNSVSNTNNTLALGTSSRATGQQATALGNEANASGQNATAIGHQAIATQSNSIILGSSTNTNNRVGIGTNTPDERLHINGSIKIVDGTQAAGRVLTSDANGRATWTIPSGSRAYADVYYNGSDLIVPSGTSTVVFGTINSSSNVNVNNNGITVLTSGRYRITYKLTLRSNSNGVTNLAYNLFLNNSIIPASMSMSSMTPGDVTSLSGNVIVSLNASQTVSLRGSTTYTQNGGGNGNGNSVLLIGNGCNLTVELID